MNETKLHEDEEGLAFIKGNELHIRDKTGETRPPGDPVASSFESNNETVGKMSVRQLIDGAWREIGLVTYEADERYRDQGDSMKCLEVIFWTHIPGHATFDDTKEHQDYHPMFAIRHDGLVLFGPNREEIPVGGAALPKVIALRSRTNGKFLCADANRPLPDGSLPVLANRDEAHQYEHFEVIIVE